ncbi:MAG: diguanylate cyclase response regulator [Phycisphaerae bacterium]|jgi:diguanylate cyclase (GGDEF)-like protein|nr:MAG: diguanylate cyclase response regulator [Phycisphaerae bacterium]
MNRRVLLVDDSALIHRLVATWLKCDQIEVVSAYTGDQAVELAVLHSVQVILLDVEMPDTNGFEVCRRLKSESSCVNIPIIFLTGASSPEDRVKGLDLGATDYITKPFHPAEFQARVRAALRTKHLLDLLQQRAQIDGLTSLRNRAYLDEHLSSELSRINRQSGTLGAIMIDVDNFKTINDTHGHLIGDEVLRQIGEVLNSQTRNEDIVARYGGEEFAILTPGVGHDGTYQLAERLRQEVEKIRIHTRNGLLRITCSLGVAYHDPNAPDTLLRRADQALYAAKRRGKNCVVVYDPNLKSMAA